MKTPKIPYRNFPKKIGSDNLPFSFYGFEKDAFETCMMLDILKKNNCLPQNGFNKTLDIGGGEGFCSLILKSLKISKHATSIDPLKYDKIKRIQLCKYFYKFKKKINYLYNQQKNIDLYNFSKHFDYPITNSSFLLRLPFFSLAKIDRQIVQKWKPFEEKFDFISVLLAFPYLERNFFSLIRNNINTNGIIFILSDYFYSQTNSIGIETGVPWNHIYYKNNTLLNLIPKNYRKESKKRILTYGENWQNKTIQDVIITAKKAGFKIIFNRRHYSNVDNERIFLRPNNLQNNYKRFYQKLLKNARKKNKFFKESDLKTSFFSIILKAV